MARSSALLRFSPPYFMSFSLGLSSFGHLFMGINFYGLTPIGFTASGFACPLSAGRLHLQAYACSISGVIKLGFQEIVLLLW